MSIDFLLTFVIDAGLMLWLGAQCWRSFILPALIVRGEAGIVKKVEQRFDRFFMLPMLVILFVANSNVVFQQHFPFLWTWRLLLPVLAIVNAAVPYAWRRRGQAVDEMLGLVDALLAVALLTVVVLSQPLLVRNDSLQLYAVIDQWFILFALCLMVGNLLFFMLIVFPLLSLDDAQGQRLALLMKQCSPLILFASAIFAIGLGGELFLQMARAAYLVESSYGRAALVAFTILIAAVIDWVWCMHEAKLLELVKATGDEENESKQNVEESGVRKPGPGKGRSYTRSVMGGVNVGVICGLGLLICIEVMNVFAGSVVLASRSKSPNSVAPSPPYRATMKTTDDQLTLKVLVTPNRFGVNTFTVTVLQQDGMALDGAQVAIYTTMTEMDMGTDVIALKPIGAGQYSAQGDLSMSGRWRLRIVVRTGPSTIHEVSILIDTPF
jgi:nitrogen fixation protein FixH